MSFPVCTLEEVLTSPEKICSEVNKVCRPYLFLKNICNMDIIRFI